MRATEIDKVTQHACSDHQLLLQYIASEQKVTYSIQYEHIKTVKTLLRWSCIRASGRATW